MARQCSRGHDGTKLGEGANVTLAKHHTHQHQISPRRRPRSSRSSSRSPWPRSRASEVEEMRAPWGNRLDLMDRREHHRRIDCDPSRRWTPVELVGRGDIVARAGERKRTRRARGCGRSV
jgi:hypothetical protein